MVGDTNSVQCMQILEMLGRDEELRFSKCRSTSAAEGCEKGSENGVTGTICYCKTDLCNDGKKYVASIFKTIMTTSIFIALYKCHFLILQITI